MNYLSIVPKNWESLDIVTQLANIGAEVGRTITWTNNPKLGNPQDCFYRALTLLDASINDPKNHNHRLRELCRTREMLVDWYTINQFGTTSAMWLSYFDAFGVMRNILEEKLKYYQR